MPLDELKLRKYRRIVVGEQIFAAPSTVGRYDGTRWLMQHDICTYSFINEAFAEGPVLKERASGWIFASTTSEDEKLLKH